MFTEDNFFFKIKITDDDDDGRLQSSYFSNDFFFSKDDKDKNITIPKKKGRKLKLGTHKTHDKYNDDNIIKGCISFASRKIHSFFCAQLEKDIKKKIQAISSQIQKTSKNAYSMLLKKKIKDLLS